MTQFYASHKVGDDTYTSVSMAWSLVTLEKWVSRMVTVPVRATWPHPQNRATPEKQRIVATSEAYGTPPKHLMQHSKQPVMGKKRKFYLKLFFLSCFYRINCNRSRLLIRIHLASMPIRHHWYENSSFIFIPVTFHCNLHKFTLVTTIL